MADQVISGRGVLIDYVSWAEKKGIKYTTFSQHEVKLSDILEIATECGISFRKGDILFVRIGVTKEWEHVMDESAKKAYAASKSPLHAGVEGTTDVLRWLWDSGFAAIAGDAISWEASVRDREALSNLTKFQVYPPKPGGIMMHEYILAGWGVPIGTFHRVF